MSFLLSLVNQYGLNEPFMLDEISTSQYSYDTIKIMLSSFVKEGKLKRYAQGVYYFPKITSLGELYPSFEVVLEKKYLKKANKVIGYYSGLTLLNQAGLTTQVPQVREITTNSESSKKRKVKIGEREVVLRKPLVKINKENILYLQFLDILRYAYEYTIKEYRNQLIQFIKQNQLKKNQLKKYLKDYPQRVERILWENNLYDEFA